jgi:hypothetical protein
MKMCTGTYLCFQSSHLLGALLSPAGITLQALQMHMRIEKKQLAK